jgi:hypothetical protein
MGQGPDYFGVQLDGSIGLLPIELSGTTDVGNGSSTIIDNNFVPSDPSYRRVDTLAIVFNTIFHLGINVPVYKNGAWSVGVKLNAGIGYQKGIVASEGLTSMVFDFPQFIYYRNYNNYLDYSILIGYKYTHAALPYHLMLAAFDINLDDMNSFRFYGSLFRYNYYVLYTNGTMEPMARIGEYGISYTYTF